ncbi:MAG: PEP-CTERM sorting domain-containing protein [Planctomycetota bacterium]
MSFSRKIIPVVAFVAFLGSCSTASAELSIDFSIDDGNTFGNAFEIEDGSVTTIGLFLSQMGGTSVLNDEGLLGFGLAGTLEAGSPGEITSVTNNPVFDFETTEQFTSGTVAMEAAVLTNAPPTGSRIFLGEFEFTSTGIGQSTFQFADLTPGSGSANVSWLSGTGTELDEQIFGADSIESFGLTLSTTAIPEPSSASLMFFGLSAFVLRRRRRRDSDRGPDHADSL